MPHDLVDEQQTQATVEARRRAENELRVAFNALLAKLDADGSIDADDFVATLAVEE